MQTANTASLLVKSNLACVWTVQLAMYTCAILRLAATCIRWLTPSGTVESSITQASSSTHCSVGRNCCGFLSRHSPILW